VGVKFAITCRSSRASWRGVSFGRIGLK
jgi:hypothetical protein